MGRYGNGMELRYGSGNGMVGFGIWERYRSSIGAAVWDQHGMIGFGIRERYGSSIGAAVWHPV